MSGRDDYLVSHGHDGGNQDPARQDQSIDSSSQQPRRPQEVLVHTQHENVSTGQVDNLGGPSKEPERGAEQQTLFASDLPADSERGRLLGLLPLPPETQRALAAVAAGSDFFGAGARSDIRSAVPIERGDSRSMTLSSNFDPHIEGVCPPNHLPLQLTTPLALGHVTRSLAC